jgi:flavin-dependent dehydrogenase
LCGYYTYWSGLPMDGRFETYIRPNRAFAAWPTNDDLTLVIGGWPIAELEANRTDIEGDYLKMLELAPPFADRVRAPTRQACFLGTAVTNYFRKPYGLGWALVGDAGYNKDFITAQGIHDAFRDAQLCATALHEAYTGVRPYDAAMDGYQSG